MKYLLTFLFFFCALFASATDNYLVATVDGIDVTYPIDSPEDFESTNHSTSTTVGDYSFTSNSESVTVARSAVKSVTLEIPLTRAIKENETYFCAYLFYNCTNLTEANITFSGSDECTTVGDSFCEGMFYRCSSLVSLPDTFNIPQGITGSVGDSFCDSMFNSCIVLVSLPASFNLPQGITSVGNYFCYGMFYKCRGLVSLPDTFNMPQRITSVGTYFCYYMFNECSSLVSLPDNFNLPQDIGTTSPSYFCDSMFRYCLKLAEGTTVELTFPFNANNAFCDTSFEQTTYTTNATANTTYKLKGNSEVYYTIKYYDQDVNLIKTQHIEKPEEGNSVTIGDFAVTADDLELGEFEVFGGWMYSDGTVATVEDVISEDVALYPIIVTYKYITYYDQYNEIIGTQKIEVDTQIGEFAVTADDLELSESQVFGGWMYSNGTVATVEDVISEDVALYPIIVTYKYITYYDQYNEIIGTQKIEVDTQITDFAVTADDLELSELQVFGGWMYSDGTVATVEDVITEDVALYPIITTIVIEEPTSISSVTTSAELVGIEYYDLAGRKVAEPQRGVNIVVEYYSDGTQKTKKFLQK